MSVNRKERLVEFNKNNIITVAKELFNEKGVLLTTVDDIAKKAQYSKSTLYVYFKSKEEIYNHIILESMKDVYNRVKSIIDLNEKPEICYYKLCNTLVEYHDCNPLYFDSVMGKISVKQTDFETQPVLFEIFKVGEEINSELSFLIKRAENIGFLKPDIEPITAVLVLWASLYGIITMATRKEEYMNDKLNITKTDYLNTGFKMLLQSIAKESV